MRSATQLLYDKAKRKNNGLKLNELTKLEKLSFLLSSDSAAENIEKHMTLNPALKRMEPEQLAQVLATLPGVGKSLATRYVLLQLYTYDRFAELKG